MDQERFQDILYKVSFIIFFVSKVNVGDSFD
jgi:hypothetical protein